MNEHKHIRALMESPQGHHRAVFTLSNTRTGNSFTFRVYASDRPEPVYFVHLLTGADNERDYTYLCMLRPTVKPARVFLTSASRKNSITDRTPSVVALRWLVERVYARPDATLPDGVEVLPSDRCGRCGRTLTTPESIRTGLGPVCAERVRGAA